MSKPYQWLAQYYDELFQPYRSPMDSARERLLGRILPDVRVACDLACGTGTTALKLARRGIRVYAVDLSAQMCKLARAKVHRTSLPVHVLQADMRSFRLPEAVDLIFCEYDAVNHIPERADLRRVARAVKRALRPGGSFFFDVNNALSFKRYWTGTVWVERPGLIVAMRNGHRKQLDRAWSDIELFVRAGKQWQRHHERVQEVCWTSREIRTIFKDAGFDRIRAWDAASFWRNPAIGAGCRTIYLAKKSED